MVSDPDKLLVETERIRSVFQQAPLVFPVTVINSVLTAVVLNPVVSHTLLWIWVAMIVAVSGIRWAIRQRFLRNPFLGQWEVERRQVHRFYCNGKSVGCSSSFQNSG